MKASIIALRFLAMREKKNMFSVRLIPLAKALIKAEAREAQCSEAEVVEGWAFKHARSAQSRELLVTHGEGDPLTASVVSAMREKEKSDAPPPEGKPDHSPYKLTRKPRKKVA